VLLLAVQRHALAAVLYVNFLLIFSHFILAPLSFANMACMLTRNSHAPTKPTIRSQPYLGLLPPPTIRIITKGWLDIDMVLMGCDAFVVTWERI
jgi:hypothetical protein